MAHFLVSCGPLLAFTAALVLLLPYTSDSYEIDDEGNARATLAEILSFCVFFCHISVTFWSRILAQNFPMGENFTKTIQKISKMPCQFCANSAQILYKFWNSVQILEFCANS